MKLQSFAVNRTLLSFDDGTEIYFSYETPVAGYSNKLGYVKTNQWYSSTTTRHVNRYLQDACYPSPVGQVSEVNQSVINNLIREYIPNRY
tara:strand:+ start:279 stop:548 length:270 start_codon:yes stop_codon:yes gene_type:complete